MLLLNLIPLIDVTFSTPTPDYNSWRDAPTRYAGRIPSVPGNISLRKRINRPGSKVALTASMVVLALLSVNCSKAHAKTESEKIPDARINLSALGLPKVLFAFRDEGPRTIIGYRFLVWLSPDEVVVGFNTSPNSRVAHDRRVDGSARLLVFGLNGELKAKRDIAYLADGYGEIVAAGEATAGPQGTVLFKIQSVNLDREGRNESKPGLLLLDMNLRDVARIDRFLEQTTFVDHALIFQEGFTLGQSRTYDIWNGPSELQTKRWQQDWPTDARDRNNFRFPVTV